MSSRIIRTIKKVALDAVTNSKPAKLVLGNVISADPLEIQINQRLILSTAQIIESQSIADCVQGETVILLQDNGGQRYMVMGVLK